MPLAAQTYFRPSSDTGSSSTSLGCGGTSQSNSSMAAVYSGKSGNGPLGPSVDMSVISPGSGGAYNFTARVFGGFPTGAKSSVFLNVSLACSNDSSTSYGLCAVSYSTDSGSTWNLLSSTRNAGQSTYVVNIGAMADLSTLQVSVCAQAKYYFAGSMASTETATAYDIWVGQPNAQRSTTYLLGLLAR